MQGTPQLSSAIGDAGIALCAQIDAVEYATLQKAISRNRFHVMLRKGGSQAQKAWAKFSQQKDADGTWLAQRAAVKHTGYSRARLRCMALDGIPWMPGRKLAIRRFMDMTRPGDYYLLRSKKKGIVGLDEMIQSRPGKASGTEGEISLQEAVKSGFTLKWLKRLAAEFLPAGKLTLTAKWNLVNDYLKLRWFLPMEEYTFLCRKAQEIRHRSRFRIREVDDNGEVWISACLANDEYPSVNKARLVYLAGKPHPNLGGTVLDVRWVRVCKKRVGLFRSSQVSRLGPAVRGRKRSRQPV